MRFKESRLLPQYDSELSDNYVTGSYDGVSMELMTSTLSRQDSNNIP